MERRYKIVADRDIPYLKGVLEPFCDVAYLNGASISAGDIRDADALVIRTRTRCNASLLDGSRVELIATATIGSDHIDSDYCERNGIEVATSAGCNARAVVQYVFATISALDAKGGGGDNRGRQGRKVAAGNGQGRCASQSGNGGDRGGGSLNSGWQNGVSPDGNRQNINSPYSGLKPRDKTIGIVGVGIVGSAVGRLAGALGFRVLYCDPPRMEREHGLGFTDMYEMLPACDIVTLHVPLTSGGPHATQGMAGREFFNRMKYGSVFINSSRGEVCDEEALLPFLRAGRITAVIDTWRNEPQINRELLELARFATPHIAGYSQEGKARGTAMAVEAIARRFSLPLTGWYPSAAPRSREDLTIAWSDIGEKMTRYFDIRKESDELKEGPGSFERFRDSYDFRREFF